MRLAGGITNGRVRVRYNYARYGYTRGGGKTWHGGIDLELLDDKEYFAPYYKDGTKVKFKVTRARIVTYKSNRTWEWGYYICLEVQNPPKGSRTRYIYLCHNAKLLVKAGDIVESGDLIAVMGNTGNAALADPPYEHVHFECRETALGTGIDPTEYCGCPNEVGTYGEEPETMSDPITIDVSKWQKVIEWDRVPYKAFIRIGYRGYGDAGTLVTDEYFERNLSGALANNKLAGFYFFSQALNVAEGKAEAEYAVKVLNGRCKGLPIFFDTEPSNEPNHNGRADHITKAARTAAAKAFCDRIKELGYMPGVYTYTAYAYANVYYADLVNENGYLGWLADVRTNYDKSLPRHIHQYTQANVPGITSGEVDMNRIVKPWGTDTAPAEPAKPTTPTMQKIMIGPVSNGDAMKFYNLAKELKLTDMGLYKAEYV